VIAITGRETSSDPRERAEPARFCGLRRLRLAVHERHGVAWRV